MQATETMHCNMKFQRKKSLFRDAARLPLPVRKVGALSNTIGGPSKGVRQVGEKTNRLFEKWAVMYQATKPTGALLSDSSGGVRS